MVLISKPLSIVIFALSLIACSDGEFGGSSGKAKNSAEVETATQTRQDEHDQEEEAQTTSTADGLGQSEDAVPEAEASLTPAEAEKILAGDGELSGDDQKILGCIAEWGTVGMTAEALQGYRRLNSSSAGFAGAVLKDSKKTDQPRLVLVTATSAGFSGVRLELMNPNGWYCIDIRNAGFSSSNTLIHCEAEVAGLNTTNTGFARAEDSRVGC